MSRKKKQKLDPVVPGTDTRRFDREGDRRPDVEPEAPAPQYISKESLTHGFRVCPKCGREFMFETVNGTVVSQHTCAPLWNHDHPMNHAPGGHERIDAGPESARQIALLSALILGQRRGGFTRHIAGESAEPFTRHDPPSEGGGERIVRLN